MINDSIHSSMNILLLNMVTSHKPTSVRNKPGYIKAAADTYLRVFPGYYVNRSSKIFGRPGLLGLCVSVFNVDLLLR